MSPVKVVSPISIASLIVRFAKSRLTAAESTLNEFSPGIGVSLIQIDPLLTGPVGVAVGVGTNTIRSEYTSAERPRVVWDRKKVAASRVDSEFACPMVPVSLIVNVPADPPGPVPDCRVRVPPGPLITAFTRRFPPEPLPFPPEITDPLYEGLKGSAGRPVPIVTGALMFTLPAVPVPPLPDPFAKPP